MIASSQPKRRYLQPRNESDNIQVKVDPDSPKSRTPSDDTWNTLSKWVLGQVIPCAQYLANMFCVSRFRELTCGSHILSRPSPIPALAWADSNLLWTSMIAPDIRSKDSRSFKMFEKNPEVQPKMRSILLDWLIEVAEVYKLHRETYYLAQDYVDRVLFASKDTPKSELQLLGMGFKSSISWRFLQVPLLLQELRVYLLLPKLKRFILPKLLNLLTWLMERVPKRLLSTMRSLFYR